MTESEKEEGRWQGEVDAILGEHKRRIGDLERRLSETFKESSAVREEQRAIQTRQQIMWSAIAAVGALVVGGAFKLWTGS